MSVKEKGCLKILAVCQNYWPEPFNVHEMCAGLVSMGHQVTVLTGLPNYPDGIIPEEYQHGKNRIQELDGVKIIRVPTFPRGQNLKGINLLKRVLNYLSFSVAGFLKAKKLDDFDVVLSFEFSPMFMVEPAIRASRLQGIPLVMYAIDLWPEDILTGGVTKEGALFRLIRRYSRNRYSKADVIAVTSPRFVDYISDYLGLADKHFEQLPQYAESMFEEMPSTTDDKTTDSVDIVFAGNIGGNQGLESAIRAFSLLPLSSIARLHIYGTGSKLGECMELAQSLSLEGRVFFHGRKPLRDMPSVYSEADAMLLTLARPSNGSLVPVYTIPRKLQSYMASGKPVLVAATGETARVVEDASCGFSCGAEDPSALASVISSFEALDIEDSRALGANARDFYRRNYSRSLFFRRLNQILQGVCK